MNGISLKSVRISDAKFLYELLEERKSFMNISHKKMPTLSHHKKFIQTNAQDVRFLDI